MSKIRKSSCWKGILVTTIAIALGFHVFGLISSTWYFGDRFGASLNEGQLGIYWGGDTNRRNHCLDNAEIWPPYDDTRFAGRAFPGMTWAFYRCDSFDSVTRSFRKAGIRIVGFDMPQFRSTIDGSSFTIPTGLPLIFLGTFTLIQSRRNKYKSNQCQNCG